MKKIIIILGILLALPLVASSGFSPSSLIYELEQNQEQCQIIILTSDSELINVSDKWAENTDVEWKVNLFETDASVHGISINYPVELSLDEREVEVCLSGDKVGEYHGVILLKEEQQGNSIVQMGIWLKVIISDEIVEETSQDSSGSSNGGGSGGSSSSSTSVKKEIEVTSEDETTDDENYNSAMTGAVVGEENNHKNWFIIFGGILFVLVMIGIFYFRRKE